MWRRCCGITDNSGGGAPIRITARPILAAFAPDWELDAVHRIHRATVDSRGRIHLRFWYGKEAWQLEGKLNLTYDDREQSMEKYRIEKRARLAAEESKSLKSTLYHFMYEDVAAGDSDEEERAFEGLRPPE